MDVTQSLPGAVKKEKGAATCSHPVRQPSGDRGWASETVEMLQQGTSDHGGHYGSAGTRQNSRGGRCLDAVIQKRSSCVAVHVMGHRLAGGADPEFAYSGYYRSGIGSGPQTSAQIESDTENSSVSRYPTAKGSGQSAQGGNTKGSWGKV